MTYNLTIRKSGSGNWVVEPVNGKEMIRPGDTVVWQIDQGVSASAQLQFLDDIFEPSANLDSHLVSVVKQGESLSLTLSAKAMSDPRVLRRTYGYAVAVIDASGTNYAIGNNPPPDLDVGG